MLDIVSSVRSTSRYFAWTRENIAAKRIQGPMVWKQRAASGVAWFRFLGKAPELRVIYFINFIDKTIS